MRGDCKEQRKFQTMVKELQMRLVISIIFHIILAAAMVLFAHAGATILLLDGWLNNVIGGGMIATAIIYAGLLVLLSTLRSK